MARNSGAVGGERRRHHLERARERALGHLRPVFLAQPVEAELILAEREADCGAQDVGPLGLATAA